MIKNNRTKLKDSLRLKWNLYRHAKWIFIGLGLSLLSYIIGIKLSNANDSSPLAMSGAAATTILILTSLYDYRTALSKSQTQAEDIFKKITDNLALTGKESMERIRNNLTDNTESATKTFFGLNACGLAFATIVWGFGELGAPVYSFFLNVCSG